MVFRGLQKTFPNVKKLKTKINRVCAHNYVRVCVDFSPALDSQILVFTNLVEEESGFLRKP